jgi:hypothetical protein
MHRSFTCNGADVYNSRSTSPRQIASTTSEGKLSSHQSRHVSDRRVARKVNFGNVGGMDKHERDDSVTVP